MHNSVQAVELVFLLLLLFVVAFGALARKLQTPYPIILVIAGTLLRFVPGIPKITLNPDVIFLSSCLPCFTPPPGSLRGGIFPTIWSAF